VQDGVELIVGRSGSGRPRVDLAAAAEEAAALSWLGATYRDVDELEIKPFPGHSSRRRGPRRRFREMLDGAELTR
jgi:hypothetical protein